MKCCQMKLRKGAIGFLQMVQKITENSKFNEKGIRRAVGNRGDITENVQFK